MNANWQQNDRTHGNRIAMEVSEDILLVRNTVLHGLNIDLMQSGKPSFVKTWTSKSPLKMWCLSIRGVTVQVLEASKKEAQTLLLNPFCLVSLTSIACVFSCAAFAVVWFLHPCFPLVPAEFTHTVFQCKKRLLQRFLFCSPAVGWSATFLVVSLLISWPIGISVIILPFSQISSSCHKIKSLFK